MFSEKTTRPNFSAINALLERGSFQQLNEELEQFLHDIIDRDDLTIIKECVHHELKEDSTWIRIEATDPFGKACHIEFHQGSQSDWNQWLERNWNFTEAAIKAISLDPDKIEEIYVVFFSKEQIGNGEKPVYHVTMQDQYGNRLNDGLHSILIDLSYSQKTNN